MAAPVRPLPLPPSVLGATDGGAASGVIVVRRLPLLCGPLGGLALRFDDDVGGGGRSRGLVALRFLAGRSRLLRRSGRCRRGGLRRRGRRRRGGLLRGGGRWCGGRRTRWHRPRRHPPHRRGIAPGRSVRRAHTPRRVVLHQHERGHVHPQLAARFPASGRAPVLALQIRRRLVAAIATADQQRNQQRAHQAPDQHAARVQSGVRRAKVAPERARSLACQSPWLGVGVHRAARGWKSQYVHVPTGIPHSGSPVLCGARPSVASKVPPFPSLGRHEERDHTIP